MTRRAHGEGCVVRRKDGRWQASLQLGGYRRTVYGKTRREAATKLAELKRQVGGGDLPAPGRRTLNDLLDEWLKTAASVLKPRTVADYEQTARLYIRSTLGRTRLDRLTPNTLQRLYGDLQTRGLHRTAVKVHAVLHRALRLAVLWRWLGDNPADRVLRPAYRAPRKDVWAEDELQRFLEGTSGHRLHPLWVVLIATGCRIGEVRALTWADVDLKAGTIRVCRNLQRVGGQWVVGTPKTKAGERTIRLPAEAVRALKRQRAQQAEWRLKAGPAWADEAGRVFTTPAGGPLHEKEVAGSMRRECLRLGLRPLTSHGLRHLHASLLLAQGLPLPAVAARLGHAHPGITASVYAHSLASQDDAGAAAIARAMESGGQR